MKVPRTAHHMPNTPSQRGDVAWFGMGRRVWQRGRGSRRKHEARPITSHTMTLKGIRMRFDSALQVGSPGRCRLDGGPVMWPGAEWINVRAERIMKICAPVILSVTCSPMSFKTAGEQTTRSEEVARFAFRLEEGRRRAGGSWTGMYRWRAKSCRGDPGRVPMGFTAIRHHLPCAGLWVARRYWVSVTIRRTPCPNCTSRTPPYTTMASLLDNRSVVFETKVLLGRAGPRE